MSENMASRVIMREDGVLKLVHLGGNVDLYWEPITAYEVMKNNPDHSVNRLDFWKYPWIVIQPESVLKPGRVFYVIPNQVISDLIKAYKLQNQISSMKHRHQYPRQSPSVKTGAEVTPIHRNHGCFHKKKHPAEARAKTSARQSPIRNIMQKIRGTSRAKVADADQAHEQFLKEFPFDSCCEMVPKHEKDYGSFKLSTKPSSWIDSWLDLSTKQEDHCPEFKGESLDDSWLKVKPPPPPPFPIVYDYDNGDDSDEIPTKQDRDVFECYRQVQARKSCLRTQSENLGRKLDGRRVTFALPDKEQKGDEIPGLPNVSTDSTQTT